MTRYEVDSAQVAAASATVRSSSAAIAAEVDRMMRALVDLQGSWRGQASTQFQHLAAEWRGTQTRVRDNLEQINAALAAAGQQYADVEERTARLFSR
jgi:6 kDa early secretory antigenic target